MGQQSRENNGEPRGYALAPVAAVAVVVAGGGMWAVSDIFVGRAVELGYASRFTNVVTVTTLTVWGWVAVAIAVASAAALAAAGVWIAAMWRGFEDGWSAAAVPVVPAAAGRAAAAAIGGGAALAGCWLVGLPAPVGVGAAWLAGCAAHELVGASVVDAVTVRALVVQAVDPYLGWPTPGPGRVRRLVVKSGAVVGAELRTGPGWSTAAVAAVADSAGSGGTGVLAGLQWQWDSRRRLLIAAAD